MSFLPAARRACSPSATPSSWRSSTGSRGAGCRRAAHSPEEHSEPGHGVQPHAVVGDGFDATRRRNAADRRKLLSLEHYRQAVRRVSSAANPEAALQRARCASALRQQLERLPKAQAEALGLHHVVGL